MLEMKINFIDVKIEYFGIVFNDCKNKINNDLCFFNSRFSKFRIGYKYMCYFWFIDFLDYIKDYKYLIRIDEDCFINKFDNDILKWMEEKN